MIKINLLNFLLPFILIFNLLNAQKELRVGYINMDYILSNIEDFEVANKEFEYKIDQWKNEILKKETEIKTKREELEFEKDLIPNQIYLKRSKELEYDFKELDNYRNKRFGPEGDWLIQEKILIQPIQDEVLAIVQKIADKNKFDFIFDKSSAVIMLYSEKKYDISELVLRSILRQEKIENLEIEFEDERKKELEEKRKLAEQKNKKRRDSISRLRELRKIEIKRKRDSLISVKRKIKT
ncbi:OmpH family outer membrane protein [Flavobacteriales bacterium]|mgnify:FL=1|nr:OmpH family outer membrane protein [Flavobacteriales bacterium]